MANVKVDNLTCIFTLTLKDDLDLDKLPLKMCSLSRCICMPNIKSLSFCNGSKVMANVKVVLKQTNNVTNKQTDKQTGQKQYAPQILSGNHKNVYFGSLAWYCLPKLYIFSIAF